MSEDRESFVFHKDWYYAIKKRSPQLRVEIYDAIMQKVFEGTQKELSEVASVVMDLISPQIDRDTEKWLDTREKRSLAGKKHKGNQYSKVEQMEQSGTNGTSVPTMEQMEQSGTNGTSVPTMEQMEHNETNGTSVPTMEQMEHNETNGTSVPTMEQMEQSGTNGTSVPTMEQMEHNETNGTVSVSVSVSDSVSVDNNSVISKEKSNTIVLDKKKKVEDAQKDFYNSLVPYVSVYGKEMIRAFYDYWTEPNKSKTKMRFQMERTWDLGRRLARWENNNKSNNNNGYGRETITDKIRRTVTEANMFSEQLRSRIGEQADVCDGDADEVW